jgi:hypothetical protein
MLPTLIAYLLGFGLGTKYVSNDVQPFAFLATTVAYAILMLLLWLHERFSPRS